MSSINISSSPTISINIRRARARERQRLHRRSLTACRESSLVQDRANPHQRISSDVSSLSSAPRNTNHVRLTNIRRLARSIGSSTSSTLQDNNQFRQQVQGSGQSSVHVRLHRHGYHNLVRGFQESMLIESYTLPPPTQCPYCQARLFHRESSDLCCLNGRIVLPPIPAPTELAALFDEHSSEARHFREHIRAYNHIFAFTSMGVHVDESLLGGRGIYTFRAQGAIYHRIGSLLPNSSERPRFLQTYVYDTAHELQNRLAENSSLHAGIIARISCILNQYNPFVQRFRHLSTRPDVQNCRLLLRQLPPNEHQYTLPTASEVAMIIVGGEEAGHLNARDIIVETRAGQLINVQDIAGYYDPLQYPLLLPCGTYGWDLNTRCQSTGVKPTCLNFYAYFLQIRENDSSLILRGHNLYQQYVVDMYVKMESHRLRWIRSNQNLIRAELYQGLQDSFLTGENYAGNVGRRTVLPSSFVGSPRDMHQRYQDAMALVREFGKPDVFLTITCNPTWPEIQQELLPTQRPQDRPDLVCRIFRSRFEEFKRDIIERGVLGKVQAYTYVIEFQKRGLPHAHMLVILEQEDKLASPDDYDKIVCAEIPNNINEPRLYASVLKHMIHGPCGNFNSSAPCMKEGRCKRRFPKPFAEDTIQGIDTYPVYRRRNLPPVHLPNSRNVLVDNSWVVPYNSWLLLKFDCHINIEVCSSIKSVKYLYKYIHKGADRVSVDVRIGSNNDEIQQFLDARWIAAPEAIWKIMKFNMSKMYPSVVRMQIHLPNMQQVSFSANQSLHSVLEDERNSRTMLTEFFRINSSDSDARNYLYREFPQHYTWVQSQSIWRRRVGHNKVIGRIYTVFPSDEEKFYLRLLLNHVKGPTSFEDLRTYNGVTYPTFKQAAAGRGLLEHDESVRQCLQEAASFHMPSALRRLFVTILIFCQPTDIRVLWDDFHSYMLEDYCCGSRASGNVIAKLLKDLNVMLLQHGKSLNDYDLPRVEDNIDDHLSIPRIIQDELSIRVTDDDIQAVANLNRDQKYAYDQIMQVVSRNEGALFFVDGPGGTGKTYLYRAILASIRKDGDIALATASSGIAATILPGGRTAHSRFKLPLNPDASSLCSISKQSILADLLRKAKAILWDEAPMSNRFNFEALDRTLRDIMEVNQPFGGKVLILGGDFRQVLPVVPRGTKAETMNSCLVRSPLWQYVRVLKLRQNMRSRFDPLFSEFLLRVGDGTESVHGEDLIKIPSEMAVPWEGQHSIDVLVEHIFPSINMQTNNSTFFQNRALLAPTNAEVDKLNDKIIRMFEGEEYIYYSFDSVSGDNSDLYQQEFLNSIAPSGMPPHVLMLKKGAPVMLLRNLDPTTGLCNGTRLICLDFLHNVIYAEILNGEFKGTRVFLPRISLKTSESANLPFEMMRKQFPVRLSFALTINKAQGQTIPNVGVYLSDHVFSHGQLYVALSRGVDMSATKLLVKNGSLNGQIGVYTRNVVYKDILLP